MFSCPAAERVCFAVYVTVEMKTVNQREELSPQKRCIHASVQGFMLNV